MYVYIHTTGTYMYACIYVGIYIHAYICIYMYIGMYILSMHLLRQTEGFYLDNFALKTRISVGEQNEFVCGLKLLVYEALSF